MPRLSIKRLTIPLKSLGLDELNPRLDPQTNQREAIRAMVKQQGEKIVNLAADIAEHGISAAERFMAIEQKKGRFRYVSLDGNRRLVALKLLHEPLLADGAMPARVLTRLKRLADTFSDDPIDEVEIALFPDREQGALWVARRHSSNMNGVGQDSWDSIDKQRFDAWRGYESREWQVLKTVLHHGTLSPEDVDNLPKIPITTLKRLTADRYIKTQLGLDYHDGRVHSTIPDADVIRPLQRMVLDLLHKRIDVTHLALTEDRRIYFDSLEETLPFREAPLAATPATANGPLLPASAEPTIGPPVEKPKPRPAKVKEQKTVILPSGQLGTAPEPLQALYRELQHVDANSYPRAGALLLEILVSASLDHCLAVLADALPAQPHREVTSTLLTKLLTIARYFVYVGQVTAEQGEAIEQVAKKTNFLATTPTIQYTNVQEWPESPTGANLRSTWTTLQPLVQAIWL